MLTVLISATDERLVLRQDIQDELGQVDAQSDALFERLITHASRRLVTYLGRPIALQKYQAMLPAYGGVTLQLPRYPIRDVFRVFEGSDTGTGLELTATEYRIDAMRGQLNRDDGFPWTRQVEQLPSSIPAEIVVPDGEYRHYLVEFSAGYVLAGGPATSSALWSTAGGSTATGPTLPSDIEDAAIQVVKRRYLGRLREPGVLSEQVGEVSITYRDSPEPLDEVMAAIEPYRSV